MDAMARCLASEYFREWGQGYHPARSAALFQTLSADGYAPGQYHLATCYLLGYNVPRNYIKAATLYKSAAEQGYAQAQVELGFIYAYGVYGFPRDIREAVVW